MSARLHLPSVPAAHAECFRSTVYGRQTESVDGIAETRTLNASSSNLYLADRCETWDVRTTLSVFLSLLRYARFDALLDHSASFL